MIIRNNDLQDVLKRIKPICSGKTPLPILNTVLIKSIGADIHLYATNLDTACRILLNATLEAETHEQEFKRCLPFDALNSFSNSLAPTDSIRIRPAHNNDSHLYTLQSMSGSASTTVETFDSMDFPVNVFDDFKQTGGSYIGTGEAYDIKVLTDIIYAASKDDSRFNLNGVLLDSAANLLVATDGHRLATRSLPEVFSQASHNAILSRSGIKHLGVFFKGLQGHIQSYLTDKRINIISLNSVACSATNLARTMVWTCRNIDGDFPEYKKVIPGDLTETCTLPGPQVRKFLKGLPTLRKNITNDRMIEIKSNCSGINISYKTPEGNETIGSFAGSFPEAFEIRLNRGYFVELIEHTDNCRILRNRTDGYGPIAIQSAGSALDILMPMRK
jgi:DNA polymerase III sliding clamp (beta) subunit (PCNA family)